MREQEVDVELQDMADGMGVSLRKLMSGLFSGRFDHLTVNDLVKGDKGDPLFFRVERSRAYSIFGSDLNDVEKDMSTIERMSRATVSAASQSTQTTADRSNESGGSVPASVGSSNGRSNRAPVQSSGGWWGPLAALGGAIGLKMILQNNRQSRPTQSDLAGARRRGYEGYFRGVTKNPHQLGTPLAEAYKEGWMLAARTSTN